MNSQPTFLFLIYFLLNELRPYYQRECKPHNFESNNSLKLSFTLNVNNSLNQTLLTFLFCVRQTWMTQMIPGISL